MPRDAHVTVNAITVHRIELFVGDEIGIVETRIAEFDPAYAGIIVADQSARPLVVEVVDRSRGRLPDQTFERRRVAVTADRQIVGIFAVIGQLDTCFDVLVALAERRYAECLHVVARIGHDPVRARVLDRDAQLRAVAVAGIDGHAVGVGHPRIEKSLVPVANFVGHTRVGARRTVVGTVHVTELPLDLLAELIARVERRNFLSVVTLLGRNGVKRIFVGSDAVGHMRSQRALTIVAGTVFILEIGPKSRFLPRNAGRKRNTNTLLLAARFRRDDDGAVGGTRTVKRRSGGAFEHRHRFHIVGIDVSRTVAVVDRRIDRIVRTARRIRRHAAVDRHAVYYEERRVVVVRQRTLATQRDANRSARTGRRLVEIQAGHLTGHAAQPVPARRIGQFLARNLRHGIAEALLLARDTERCDHHGIDLFRGRDKRDVEGSLRRQDTQLLRFVPQKIHLQHRIVGRDTQ